MVSSAWKKNPEEPCIMYGPLGAHLTLIEMLSLQLRELEVQQCPKGCDTVLAHVFASTSGVSQIFLLLLKTRGDYITSWRNLSGILLAIQWGPSHCREAAFCVEALYVN